jgi:hypothetical protein
MNFRQDWFMENFLNSQRSYIFRDVEVLLYVFDINSEHEEVQAPSFQLK